MRAMVFEGSGAPLRETRAAGARAGARSAAAAGAGVRRVPHRPAPARRRGRRSPPRRACSATRSSATVGCRRRRRRAGSRAGGGRASASACRGSAGPTAPASTARAAARTCARDALLHRPRHRRRLSPSTRSPTRATASRCPTSYPDEQLAPLLCAGLIGYRALRMCGEARRLGLYGFGASAHIIAQVARWQGREVYAFTRAGDDAAQAFALRARRRLGRGLRRAAAGAARRGDRVRPGGRAGAAGAARARARRNRRLRRHPHERHPLVPLQLLWEERALRSVANLTRRDGEELLALAPAACRPHPREHLPARACRRCARRTSAPGPSPGRR